MSSVSSLSFRSVLGLNKHISPNILFVGEEFIVFAAGNSIVSHNINSRQQRIFAPPEEFSTGVSAIAYADGKPNVAFGDNSIQPSVCIFDVHSQSPLNFFHLGDDFSSTGFVSLSFSGDGHYLLGHGSQPGWNLVVWSLESNQIVDSVKTADDDTPVTQCTFSPGKNTQIAVTGDNILRIFKLEDDKLKEVEIQDPKIGNIVCHLWLNEATLLCSNTSGDIICVTSDPQQSVIEKCDHRDSAFVAMTRYKKGFLAASEGGYLTKFDVSSTTPGKYVQVDQVKLFGDELPISAHTIAVDPSEETAVISLVNNRVLTVSLSNGDILQNMEEKPLVMPFHDGAILCCSTCCRRPLVATCGVDKTVRVWNYIDNSLEIVKEFTESVYSVSFHPDGLTMLIGFGDKLRMCGVFYDDIRPFREFPIRGCRCVKFSNGGHLFAAVNGSKIQIYNALTYQLVNTLHRHSAGVHSLVWGESDTVIASVANDGAMYVHRSEGINREENYTTSQIQYHSVTCSADFSSIYICGSDMKVKEIQSGQIAREVPFQTQHTQLVMSNNSQMLFSGTKDGKVFSFALPLGPDRLIMNCHTGPVTSMAISFDDSLLFTVGEDGVLCIFNIRDKDNRIHTLERSFFSEEVMTTRAELEEKAGQQRTLEAELADLDVSFKMKRDMIDSTYKSKQASKLEKAKKLKDKWRVANENLKKSKDETEMNNKAEEKRVTKEWTEKIAAKDDDYVQQVVAAHNVCEQLAEDKKRIESDGMARLESEEASFRQIIEEMQATHRARLEDARIELETETEAKRIEALHIEEMKKEILAERAQAITDCEKSLRQELEANEHQRAVLQDELQSKTKDCNSLQKQMDQNNAEGQRYTQLMQKLESEERQLNADNNQLAEEIRQKNVSIKERETKIATVKKENQELDKYHAVLTHQENALRQQTGPLDSQIVAMEQRINEMDGQLERAHKKKMEQNESIQGMQDRLRQVIISERNQTQRLTAAKCYFEQAKNDLYDVVQSFHDKDRLKSKFIGLYNKYVKKEKIEDIQLDENVEAEHKRQKATLQKQLKELKRQHTRDNQFQIREQAHLLEENAALIVELQRLRDEHRALESEVKMLMKKGPGTGKNLLPATEAHRMIEANKAKIMKLEEQLANYNQPRVKTSGSGGPNGN